MGYQSGNISQGTGSISVGWRAGYTGQGQYAIAIGVNAGASSQHSRTIVLNATGAQLNTEGQDRTYINPVRPYTDSVSGTGVSASVLYYNSSNSEILREGISGVTAFNGTGAAYTTLFSTSNINQFTCNLVRIATGANDGTYGLFCFILDFGEAASGTGIVNRIFSNNIDARINSNNFQVRAINTASYTAYFNVLRI
jgi:hypothetical protein